MMRDTSCAQQCAENLSPLVSMQTDSKFQQDMIVVAVSASMRLEQYQQPLRYSFSKKDPTQVILQKRFQSTRIKCEKSGKLSNGQISNRHEATEHYLT